ncbi:145_t:CDS:2, partial [Acaulospora colombiana]
CKDSNEFPIIWPQDRLEAHQQQTEDIKKAITKIFTCQRQAFKLVSDLSLAREQTQQFSSSAFISEAHECQQLEAGHLWMQPVKYMDFELGESSDTVVFGTEKGMEIMTTVLNTILEGKLPFSNLQIDQAPRRKKMIELERQFRVTGPVSETLSTLEDSQLGALLGFIGLSQSPLVIIQDEEVKRYSK